MTNVRSDVFEAKPIILMVTVDLAHDDESVQSAESQSGAAFDQSSKRAAAPSTVSTRMLAAKKKLLDKGVDVKKTYVA